MKKLLATIMGVTMLASVATGVSVLASADGETQENGGWKLGSGTATATYDAESGWAQIDGLNAWGERIYNENKVKIDGLTVEIYSNKFNKDAGTFFGFNIVGVATDYGPDKANVFNATYWPNSTVSNQTRIAIAKSHNPGAAYQIASSTIEGALANTPTSTFYSSYVYSNVEGELGAKFEFDYLEESDVWQLVITTTAGTTHGQQKSPQTMYINKQWFDNALDSEGYAYISTAANVSGSYDNSDDSGTPVFKIKYTEASEEVEETVDPIQNQEWKLMAGSATTTYEPATGYHVVSGLGGWGSRTTHTNNVKVDGLTLDIYTDTYPAASAWYGLSFVTIGTDHYGPDKANAFSICIRPGMYEGQTRVATTKNHDGNAVIAGDSVANALAGTAAGAGIGSLTFAQTEGAIGVRYVFTHLADEGVYKIDVTITAGTRHSVQSETTTQYIADSWISSVANENGEVAISAWGSADTVLKIKYEDANLKAYNEGAYATADTAVNAYNEAVGGAVATVLEAREAALNAIESVRANDVVLMKAKVAKVDAKVAETAQNEVKAIVQEAYTAADTAFAVLETEANLTEENIEAAKTAAEAAKAKYDGMVTLLSDDNKTYFLGLSDGYAYALNLANAKVWVIDYETKVEALKTASVEALVEDIVAVKALREGYAGSATETLVNGLNETDKAALTARITTADESLAATEEESADDVKDYYLDQVEAALEEDITIKQNLDDAKAAYANVIANVEIVEADGELYTRLTTAYATIKTAAETYVNGLIEAVEDALEQEYTTLSAFDAVKAIYNAIDLAYLMEENTTIAAAYETVKTAYSANFWSKVTTTGLTADVEQSSTGLYVESVPSFPARFNYNEKLNIKQEGGVEVVVELTETAFYNDGNAANNIVFNFLGAPDSYKSMSDGITIMIWLFEAESNVHIYNNTDTMIEKKVITTPLDGSNLTIKVEFKTEFDFATQTNTDFYVITLNGVEIKVEPERLTAEGHEVPDEVYFSMGSFADVKDNPNCFTLISVDGVEFAKEEEPTPPPASSDSNSSSEPTTPPTNSDNGGEQPASGCGSAIGASLAAILLPAAAFVAIKKRKED